MHFTIQREALLKPLQLVAGVVERRQTLPVLSNVLLVVEGQQLSLTGTDLEVELVGRVQLEEPAEPGDHCAGAQADGHLQKPAQRRADRHQGRRAEAGGQGRS
jgi:DNA polymerase III sliding clamp (beta) subunit (PCNA family)